MAFLKLTNNHMSLFILYYKLFLKVLCSNWNTSVLALCHDFVGLYTLLYLYHTLSYSLSGVNIYSSCLLLLQHLFSSEESYPCPLYILKTKTLLASTLVFTCGKKSSIYMWLLFVTTKNTLIYTLIN